MASSRQKQLADAERRRRRRRTYPSVDARIHQDALLQVVDLHRPQHQLLPENYQQALNWGHVTGGAVPLAVYPPPPPQIPMQLMSHITYPQQWTTMMPTGVSPNVVIPPYLPIQPTPYYPPPTLPLPPTIPLPPTLPLHYAACPRPLPQISELSDSEEEEEEDKSLKDERRMSEAKQRGNTAEYQKAEPLPPIVGTGVRGGDLTTSVLEEEVALWLQDGVCVCVCACVLLLG